MKNQSNPYKIEKINYDDSNCNLKFLYCDENKFQMYQLSKTEIKSFISFAKKIEGLKWQEIKVYSGFKYENINHLIPPVHVDKDIILSSMRITDKFRLIGYRKESEYYIVWFDKNHTAYKQKR